MHELPVIRSNRQCCHITFISTFSFNHVMTASSYPHTPNLSVFRFQLKLGAGVSKCFLADNITGVLNQTVNSSLLKEWLDVLNTSHRSWNDSYFPKRWQMEEANKSFFKDKILLWETWPPPGMKGTIKRTSKVEVLFIAFQWSVCMVPDWHSMQEFGKKSVTQRYSPKRQVCGLKLWVSTLLPSLKKKGGGSSCVFLKNGWAGRAG